MAVDNFEALHNSAEALRGSIGKLTTVLEREVPKGGSAAFKAVPLNGLKVETYLDGVLKATIALSSLKAGEIFPPPSFLSDTRNALEAVRKSIDSLVDFFEAVGRDHGGASRIDSGSRTVLANNGNTLSFSESVESLNPGYDTLVRHMSALVAVSSSRRRRGPAIANIAAAASAAAAAAKAAEQSATRAETTLGEVLHDSKMAATAVADLKATIDRLNSIVTAAEASKISAEESRDAAEKAKSDILETADLVLEQDPIIQAAAKRLEAVYKEVESQKTIIGAQLSDAEILSKKIEALTKQANEMVKGATVAGLATSFGKSHTDLGVELVEARKSVRNAIWVTIALSSPLWLPSLLLTVEIIWAGIVSFFAGLGIEWAAKSQARSLLRIDQPSFPNNGYGLTAYLAARSALVVPGIVLLWFAIKRHNALFLLREHYAYKHSMAMSVTGFKLEAPQYQQEIAAMTLAEVAFNPGDSLVPPRRKPFGARRFFSRIAGKIEDKVAEGASDATKKSLQPDPK